MRFFLSALICLSFSCLSLQLSRPSNAKGKDSKSNEREYYCFLLNFANISVSLCNYYCMSSEITTFASEAIASMDSFTREFSTLSNLKSEVLIRNFMVLLRTYTLDLGSACTTVVT